MAIWNTTRNTTDNTYNDTSSNTNALNQTNSFKLYRTNTS